MHTFPSNVYRAQPSYVPYYTMHAQCILHPHIPSEGAWNDAKVLKPSLSAQKKFYHVLTLLRTVQSWYALIRIRHDLGWTPWWVMWGIPGVIQVSIRRPDALWSQHWFQGEEARGMGTLASWGMLCWKILEFLCRRGVIWGHFQLSFHNYFDGR